MVGIATPVAGWGRLLLDEFQPSQRVARIGSSSKAVKGDPSRDL
jgi:hypothetical protein